MKTIEEILELEMEAIKQIEELCFIVEEKFDCGYKITRYIDYDREIVLGLYMMIPIFLLNPIPLILIIFIFKYFPFLYYSTTILLIILMNVFFIVVSAAIYSIIEYLI